MVLAGAGTVFCAGADLAGWRRWPSYTHEENVRDADGDGADVTRRSTAAGAAHRPRPRRRARRRRRPRGRLRHRRRRRARRVRIHRGQARHRAGGDLAVRAREDRRLGRAGAVPDRHALRRGAGQGDRARPRGRPGAELDARVGGYVEELLQRGAGGDCRRSRSCCDRCAGASGRRTRSASPPTHRRAARLGRKGQEGTERAFLEKREATLDTCSDRLAECSGES